MSSISYDFHLSSKCFLCTNVFYAPWTLTSRHCFSSFLLSFLSLRPLFFPCALPFVPLLWLLCSWISPGVASPEAGRAVAGSSTVPGLHTPCDHRHGSVGSVLSEGFFFGRMWCWGSPGIMQLAEARSCCSPCSCGMCPLDVSWC